MIFTARGVFGRLWLVAAVLVAAVLVAASPALANGDHRRDGKRQHVAHVTNKVTVNVNSGRRLGPENERALVNMTLLRETIRMQQRSGVRRCPGAINSDFVDCAIPSGARIVGTNAR